MIKYEQKCLKVGLKQGGLVGGKFSGSEWSRNQIFMQKCVKP